MTPTTPDSADGEARVDRGRRAALQLLVASCVAGCSTDPVLPGLYRTADLLFRHQPRYPLTRAQADELPYASLGASFGNGRGAVLILASYDGADLRWVSADRVLLVTRGGRLVKTAGLPQDLRRAEFVGGDPVLAGLHRLNNPVVAECQLDLLPGNEFGVPAHTRFTPGARESITILDRSCDVVRVEERITVPLWNWSATNTWWADAATGFVWRSIQQFCPQTPAITLETLKPPA